MLAGERPAKARAFRRHSLEGLGLDPDPSWSTFDLLHDKGWRPLNRQGAHASAHVHPTHPGIVVRIAAEADGFARYALLLRDRFAAEVGVHAPLIHDMAIGRNGTLVAICERLTEPTGAEPWLAAARAILLGQRSDPDPSRRWFEKRWPRFVAFAEALGRATGRPCLDANGGNILLNREGMPVINDPIPDRIGQESWVEVADALLPGLWSRLPWSPSSL